MMTEDTGAGVVRDDDEGPISVTLVGEPGNGSVTWGADGSFTYTHNLFL